MSDVHPGPLRLLSQLVQTAQGTEGVLSDCRLFSHFQPIYSFSHRRLVGHEALLRARSSLGERVSPLDVLAACQDERDLAKCDRLSRLVHLSNFKSQAARPDWLFLNVHPEVFRRLTVAAGGEAYLRAVCRHFDLDGPSLVLEVLESPTADVNQVAQAMAIAKSVGILLAIDDFGAGHSNFDRVWQLRPDIVKLDRSLVARAAHERRAQRIMSQMVALLHECGAMVLVEGVENRDEALVALDCDADMVQGYFFGYPQVELMPVNHAPECLLTLNRDLQAMRKSHRSSYREAVAPLLNAVGYAGTLLSAGRSLVEASASIMALTDIELCYVLDGDGFQIGPNLWSLRHQSHAPKIYEPLRNTDDACWAQRPYFRRAIAAPNQVQITRPYRTIFGQHACVTASMAYLCQINGERLLRVICADIPWQDDVVALASEPSANLS